MNISLSRSGKSNYIEVYYNFSFFPHLFLFFHRVLVTSWVESMITFQKLHFIWLVTQMMWLSRRSSQQTKVSVVLVLFFLILHPPSHFLVNVRIFSIAEAGGKCGSLLTSSGHFYNFRGYIQGKYSDFQFFMITPQAVYVQLQTYEIQSCAPAR